MEQKTGRTADILLVEDNPGDVMLIEEALADSKIRNILHVVSDGEQAMEFVRKQGNHAGAPRPDLILLDLNLPKKNGKEVLREVKSDPDLKSIPVIVLTSSKSEEDVVKSYELHANAYICKPFDFHQFVKVMQTLEDFWFVIVKLPPQHA
jgi:two-component system, chemotaxis family, response regulator Rcp1